VPHDVEGCLLICWRRCMLVHSRESHCVEEGWRRELATAEEPA